MATRAQVRTSSTGDTGFSRKSATRICTNARARFSSNAWVIDDDRRPGADPRHQPIEREHLLVPAGIEVDDRHCRAFQAEIACDRRERARHHTQLDLLAGAERRLRLLLEAGIRREHDHLGLACCIT